MNRLSTLSADLTEIRERSTDALDRLREVLDDPRPIADVLADPDSPLNAARTLASLRLELAALRDALRPFAQAYTRMADALDDVQVPVFLDPNRPDKNRFVYLGDFKRAHQAYHSPAIAAETADRIERLETDMKRAGQLLSALFCDDGDAFSPEDVEEWKRLAKQYGGKP